MTSPQFALFDRVRVTDNALGVARNYTGTVLGFDHTSNRRRLVMVAVDDDPNAYTLAFYETEITRITDSVTTQGETP